MNKPIQTSRLRLELLSTDVLQVLVDGNLEQARELVGFQISCGTSLIEKIWVSRRLNMIQDDPSQHPWMYRAIVREVDNEMVGHISFHHKYPDPDLARFSDKGVELGYTIEPPYRRRGYARESVLGMIQWARKEQENIEVFVTISPENEPSIKLAETMGFMKVGEHQDDIDGLEYVMKYSVKNPERSCVQTGFATKHKE